MAKPRNPAYNRPDTSEGTRDRESELGVVEVEAEVRGGKQGGAAT